MPPYGATPGEWAHFDINLGLTEHLLPVVSSPTAPISPKSKIKSIGQIPSIYNENRKAAGFAGWPQYRSTAQDISKWSKEPDYGICLQCREVRALDCDLPDGDISQSVYRYLEARFPGGKLPIRGRSNSSKFLLAFRLPGDYTKRIIKIDDKNKIEFLAGGQQFIAIGTHPSGVKYEWAGGLPEDVPEITGEQFEQLWADLAAEFGVVGTADGGGAAVARRAPGGLAGADPVLDWLSEQGSVLGWGAEGQAYIACPFKAGHTKEGDITETAYFPAGLRGYAQGHFNCFHASCGSRDDGEFLDGFGYRALSFDDLGPVDKSVDSGDKDLRFRFTLNDDFIEGPLPPWIIKDVLPRADLAVIYGESGAGKSFVAYDMAMAVARGVEWNGHKTEAGSVFYICAEGAGGMKKRGRAYKIHNQCERGSPCHILADVPNLLLKNDAKDLTTAILAVGRADIVFVDTLAQTTPGGSEDAENMGAAIANCKALARATGALVVLIHHAGKDLTKGARGWSGLKAAADTEIEVSRDGENRALRVSKQKDGEEGAEWGFSLLDITVGLDEDEKTISSCVVEYGPVVKRKMNENKRMGVVEAIILEVFDVLGGSQCSVKDILDETVKKIPNDPGKRDTRRQRALRAIQNLTSTGHINSDENRVWIDL